MTSPSNLGSRDDQQAMSSFRYTQELRRTIRLFGSFAVSFSFISITTGIFANYKSLLENSGPVGLWTWPLVTVGQLLVALVFAELASRMPLTGYSYQWVTRLAGPAWGWLTGWIAVCFLVIVVPSVDHVIADVIGHVFEIPAGSAWLTAIVCTVIGLQAVIHVFGVRLASVINSVAVFTEMAGMVGLVALFGFLALRNGPSLEILGQPSPLTGAGQGWTPWLMGCLMGAYTLVGFESAANLSEETIDAASTVPRAVVWSVVVSGGVGTVFLVVVTLGITNLPALAASDYPLPEIIRINLGSTMSNLFLGLVVVSVFACGLIIMASGSRLVYAMARDNVFPASQLFRRVSPGSAVPVPAILLILVLGVLAEIFSESIQQLLLAAAVLPATIYLLTVLSYLARRSKMPHRFGTFSLGRWGPSIAAAAAAWLIVTIAILTIPEDFRRTSLVSLGVCASGLIPWFAWIRRRVATGTAGIDRIAPRFPGPDEYTEFQDVGTDNEEQA
ncbi:MAG: amino acid permease [Planctomycetaceae bacterium]|nr:amino acid permease [Planctomycetaceae bacterium]MDP7275910.1 amino acid permease [Planctomycetaceae bacterium]